MTRGCHELRTELSRLTYPADDAGMDWLDFQIREIAALNERCAHSIVVDSPSSDATAEMNCFTRAFDIEPGAINDMCLGDVFPGSNFVSALMRGALSAKEEADTTTGDIVIYLDGDSAPRHAGKISGGGKIISKWGAGRTHVWKHGLWEVPVEYGNDVQFFNLTAS